MPSTNFLLMTFTYKLEIVFIWLFKLYHYKNEKYFGAIALKSYEFYNILDFIYSNNDEAQFQIVIKEVKRIIGCHCIIVLQILAMVCINGISVLLIYIVSVFCNSPKMIT